MRDPDTLLLPEVAPSPESLEPHSPQAAESQMG